LSSQSSSGEDQFRVREKLDKKVVSLRANEESEAIPQHKAEASILINDD
jgi:hypothetical protein